jgi:hypothetical protein
MNKLGQYDDGRSNYNFSFGDGDGKHISVSFRAEPDYDLDIIFNEFRNFLIASGHDIEGHIGELFHEEDEWEDNLLEEQNRSYREAAVQNFQNKTQDKFSMDHLPNNGWPFGGLTTASIAALTTADIAPLTVTNLDTNQTYAYKDRLMQNPTMAPITSQQIQSWSLSSAGIQSLTVADLSTWKMDAPGTAGSARVKF